ncbi:MAG TPA: hypothetical protein VMZ73_09340 [Acidimicrobiales bacterium]|nr:hypothetical protein [Acidimicrobiales bacterium]
MISSELNLIANNGRPRVRAYEDGDEQVDSLRPVVLALHRRGDVAVEGEWDIGVAGLDPVAGEVGGDIDLEPVLGE